MLASQDRPKPGREGPMQKALLFFCSLGSVTVALIALPQAESRLLVLSVEALTGASRMVRG